MKAILCSQYCQPDDLVLADVPDPVAGPGEAVIAIKAAALNFFDILMIQGKYQIKPPFPFSPAAEVAGVIESIGPGVTDLKVGDRVVASCGHNGAREKIALPAAGIVKIPDNLDYDRAAGIIIIYGTALHALEDRASPKPGETLAVLGAAGGTGLAACELGKLMGLKVIACASSDEKLEFAKAHGAELTLNYAKEDLKEGLRKLTGGKGVDIIFDPVGGAYAEQALRSIAWEGRFLVIGFCRRRYSEDAAEPRAAEGLRHQRRVLGRLDPAESGEEPRQSREAREVDGGRQDLLACRPHVPAGADRRRNESAGGTPGHGQGDPASVRTQAVPPHRQPHRGNHRRR
ncbi:NADPH:quinone reductase-like Zn-dependent oxidoreductase [Bradyrhizobium sp. USDA 4469]